MIKRSLKAGPDIPKALLNRVFGDNTWELDRLRTEITRTTDFYYTPIGQVKMSQASSTVTLLGDAGCFPSLVTGQGATNAITSARVLAGEIFAASR